MKICKDYLKARTAWKRRYAELERRYEEAERAEQWNRAERIGEALAELGSIPASQNVFPAAEKAVRRTSTVSYRGNRWMKSAA